MLLLSVSPFEEDHLWLRHMLNGPGWEIRGVRSGRQALAFLRRSSASVVMCEEHLPDCSWREVLDEMQRLDDPPSLIVTSRLADDRLWAEVLNLGAYDLLMKPFDANEVVRVAGLAGQQWKHRLATRLRERESLKAALAGT